MSGPPWRKVAAFVLRRRASGRDELLAHGFEDDPALPLRLPGGGVDEGESPLDALWRELAEETGLTDLELLRPLGTHHYFKPYIQAHVERHDFLLRAPAATPDAWRHAVQGTGEDAGHCFCFCWLGHDALHRLDEEFRPHVTPCTVPELFAEP